MTVSPPFFLFFVIMWCVWSFINPSIHLVSYIFKIQGSQLCSVPAQLMDKGIPISDSIWESESSEGLLV